MSFFGGLATHDQFSTRAGCVATLLIKLRPHKAYCHCSCCYPDMDLPLKKAQIPDGLLELPRRIKNNKKRVACEYDRFFFGLFSEATSSPPPPWTRPRPFCAKEPRAAGAWGCWGWTSPTTTPRRLGAVGLGGGGGVGGWRGGVGCWGLFLAEIRVGVGRSGWLVGLVSRSDQGYSICLRGLGDRFLTAKVGLSSLVSFGLNWDRPTSIFSQGFRTVLVTSGVRQIRPDALGVTLKAGPAPTGQGFEVKLPRKPSRRLKPTSLVLWYGLGAEMTGIFGV